MLWSKGVKEFIEAAKIVNRSYSNINFLIAGRVDDKNPDGIKKSYLDDINKLDYINWIGHTDDVKNLLNISNIVCLPTFYGEGVPKILIEACASKRAVICSNIPGCMEIIEHNFNGLVIPPKNSNQLAKAMMKLINAPELKRSFHLMDMN